jgi:hypothetical protein
MFRSRKAATVFSSSLHVERLFSVGAEPSHHFRTGRLRALAGSKSLQSLDVRGCRGVTGTGVQELKKALPECKISR